MRRSIVIGQIAVDEAAPSGVAHGVFMQGGAQAPNHAADGLAAGSLLVLTGAASRLRCPKPDRLLGVGDKSVTAGRLQHRFGV